MPTLLIHLSEEVLGNCVKPLDMRSKDSKSGMNHDLDTYGLVKTHVECA